MNKLIAQALAGLQNSDLVLMDARMVIHGGTVSRGTRLADCGTPVRTVTVAMAAGYGTGMCPCHPAQRGRRS